VKPARFHYLRAESKREAIELLAEHGPDARILAGGQSLVPLLNRRLVRPRVLIDIGPAEDLRQIADGESIELGATVSQLDLERSVDIARELPLVRQALRWVGSVATKTRGTLGGSAAFADPAAELPAALSALDAEFVAESRRGRRAIASESFFVDSFQTSLAADELLTHIRVRPIPTNARSCFIEIARRRGGARAIMGIASILEIGTDGVCASARLALMGAAGGPKRLAEAERSLSGEKLNATTVNAALEAALAHLGPSPDGSISSRSWADLAVGLLRQALGTGTFSCSTTSD
jgi:carbon-monoxide dehydrogenase medium subunit